MTTAILKSFNRDQHVAVLSVHHDGPDCAFGLCGSDRSVVAHLPPGQVIRFEISRNRYGELFAVDVTPVPSTTLQGSSARAMQCKDDTSEPQTLKCELEISLDELLTSCVVRQMMARDGVDPEDVRRLIAAMADAQGG